MRTVEYLDELKRRHNIATDYKLAQLLGVMDKQLYHYRKRGVTFSDGMCIKVAELLSLHPGAVIADIHAERAKVDQERAMWADIANKLRGLAAAVCLGVFVLIAAEGESWGLVNAGSADNFDFTRYTLCAFVIAALALTLYSIALKMINFQREQ